MTDDDKLAKFVLVTGESDEELARLYLERAEQAVLERRYPLTEDRSMLSMPARYDGLQIDIAVAMWARRGAEGESEHAENGVNRVYEHAESYLKRVVPCIGYEDGAR